MIAGDRPRELRWYHAGPMLFSDLGTSRLYVLGLAYHFTRDASLFHILAVNLLLVLVATCYLLICRKYPEGGGVYSSARHASRTLAVIGALMLCADYTVTAAMSCLDAFRYLGINGHLAGMRADVLCTLGAIGVVGVVNWFGPRGMARAALWIALGTSAATLVISVMAVPYLYDARIEFPIRDRYDPSAWGEAWVGFTEIVLALSGIEAIANMTGIMVPPVRSTARRAIIPVLVEVVALNLILGAAMNALPVNLLLGSDGTPVATDDMLNVLAQHYVGKTFAAGAALVFGLLLISAMNTAVCDLLAIQYMMAKDGEAPAIFSRLNRHGVPVAGLLLSTALPGLLVVLFPSITQLAGLYSVGVVAAIAINLLSTAFTREFELNGGERRSLALVGGVMTVILATLLWNKPEARVFSLTILNLGLAGRLYTLAGRGRTGPGWTRWLSGGALIAQCCITFGLPYESASGFILSVALLAWLIVAGRRAAQLAPAREEVRSLSDLEGDYEPGCWHLLAAKRPSELGEPVVREAKRNEAGVVVLFVRELATPLLGSSSKHMPGEDPAALEVFHQIREVAQRLGVPLRLVYLTGASAPERIIACARDHGCRRVYLHLPTRSGLQRFLGGDVISRVAEGIPQEMELVIRG